MSGESITERRSLLGFAVRLAREAGELANRYFKGSFAIERKADQSLVTTADREIEALMRDAIQQSFPDDGMLGEESAERMGTSGRRWIIDPIDGTYSFVHGVPLFAVLIGLEVRGESVLGVVNLPALDELVYAARGLGCFWNGEPARVSPTTTLEEALLLSTDFGTCEAHGFRRAADALQNRVHARRTWGDAYGHVLVATGRADVMLDPVMNVWDCAALQTIVEEAGGTFTDWHAQKTINGGNAISMNALLFDEVMNIIRENSHDDPPRN